MNELVKEIESIKEICKILMETQHYGKLGPAGIFAIIQKCKAVGVDPMEGLNGGMYYVSGKVEMSSVMMSSLIRKAGHSITCSENTPECCILHGKRKDSGDTWKTSFSIDDAKRAGLLRNTIWSKYPDIMLYNRALSKLARQLFPDVIGGCYVEGEITIDPDQQEILPIEDVVDMTAEVEKDLSLKARAECLIQAQAIKSFDKVPRKVAEKLRKRGNNENNQGT